MMKIFMKTFLLIVGMSTFSVVSLPREMIDSFHSDIVVHQDATMTVTETIQYTNTNISGSHGIMRDFPTRYKDRWGNRVHVAFTVKQVLRDGLEVPYRVVPHANGKRVYIGDPNRFIFPGTYTYTIVYTTSRQLGFFESHDELYWNVTGLGWPVPISHVSAQVMLPSGVPQQDIEAEGYTGAYGSRQHDLTAQVAHNGTSVFNTTRSLMPHEGLTIVVSWPKGFVQAPTWFTYWQNLLYDNRGLLVLIIGFLTLSIFYFVYFMRWRNRQQQLKTTIIPRFYPPQDLLPSELFYIYHKKFSTKAFAAEMVNMAVMGMIRIVCSDHTWNVLSSKFHARYVLNNNKDFVASSADNEVHKKLSELLFAGRDTLIIDQSKHRIINRALNALKEHVSSSYEQYIDRNTGTKTVGVILSILFVVLSLMITADEETGSGIFALFDSIFAYVICVGLMLINVLFFYLMNGYTKNGMGLYEEIEGFKMFLSTTEAERLAIVGTPPNRTPELYETYLPYAMVLGVERQWSAQFAPIFACLEQEGHHYTPSWYTGYYPVMFFDSFATSLHHSLPSAISSSINPPGSSSGRGGGGFSGGGGGGGGGGSW